MALAGDVEQREYDKFALDTAGNTAVRVLTQGFDISGYDYIELGYTGEDLTSVVYKKGGASGTIIATLTLAYNSGKLISVLKS